MLWITRCNIIHITTNNESSIEELIEVKNEIIELINTAPPFLDCVWQNNITILSNISSIPTSTLKG